MENLLQKKLFFLKKNWGKFFLYKTNMDHAQFGHANENETRFLAVGKSLLKREDNTKLKVQETLEFKMTKPKEDLNFDHYINVPE